MRQEGIRLALAVVYLSSSVMALLGEAAASGDAPWVDGFYVPRDQVASCKEPNFEVYDWVLRFQKNRRSEMGTSDGICGVSNIVNVGRGLYQSQLDCDSQGEKSTSSMTFQLDDSRKITEIDGHPYAFCAPLK